MGDIINLNNTNEIQPVNNENSILEVTQRETPMGILLITI